VRERPRTARDLLAIATAQAWADYLDTTRNLDGARYGEVEPWAWTRMQQRLRAVKARVAALEKPPGRRKA
jgi:hypothetical protein